MIFCLKNGGVTRLWLMLEIYWNWRKAKREHRGMPLWSSLSIKRILLQSTYFFLIPSITTNYSRLCLLQLFVFSGVKRSFSFIAKFDLCWVFNFLWNWFATSFLNMRAQTWVLLITGENFYTTSLDGERYIYALGIC